MMRPPPSVRPLLSRYPGFQRPGLMSFLLAQHYNVVFYVHKTFSLCLCLCLCAHRRSQWQWYHPPTPGTLCAYTPRGLSLYALYAYIIHRGCRTSHCRSLPVAINIF
jgi:hypothetical protein